MSANFAYIEGEYSFWCRFKWRPYLLLICMSHYAFISCQLRRMEHRRQEDIRKGRDGYESTTSCDAKIRGKREKEREVVKRRTRMDAQTEYRNNNAYNLSSSRVGSFFFSKTQRHFCLNRNIIYLNANSEVLTVRKKWGKLE